MKAVRIHEFGGPEVLKFEDAPVPVIANDEVLVKVFATSVNPIDWKIREGKSKEKFPTSFPLILGWDLSGVVEQVGQDVKQFRQGDEVYGRPDPTRDGAYAEYIAVKASHIAYKPKSLSHEEAASIPLAGLTAWQGLFDHGQLTEGQSVLVHAASGGVGSLAIQFAKWKGAYVYGTASKENITFCQGLGAETMIDYKNEKFEDKVNDVNLVFDTIGGETQTRSFGILVNGGRLITTVKPENPEPAESKHITVEGFMAQSYPEQLKQIAALIDNGKVKPVVSQIFSLEHAADAQKISEQGHTRGKIVIRVNA